MVTRVYGRRGGIARTSLETAEQLAARGHHITVLTNQVDRDYNFNNIDIHRVRLIGLPHSVGIKMKNLVEVPQFVLLSTIAVLLTRRRYDVVWNKGNTQCLVQDVVTSESCHRAWIGERKAAGEKKHFFYPLHHFILAVEKWNYRRAMRRQTRLVAEKPRQGNLPHASGFSPCITTISKMVRRDIINSYPFLSEDDIGVIYNGVNRAEFVFDPDARKAVRKRHGIAPDGFTALFVGWEFERKGLEYIIGALPLIGAGRIKLLVVGGDSPARYRKIVEKSGVEDDVIFCGSVDDVAAYYSAADVFILPTRMDAFGLVVLEAMSAGRAVIISSTAGAAELIEHGANGFILEERTSSREIAGIAKNLIDDPGLKETVGEAAAETAAGYDWDAIGAEYERFLKNSIQSA